MVTLLQWCILEPYGPSNLAAIRFASPVSVKSLVIYPTGARPFAQSPDVVSRTEPEAFFLEVYFNAHPVPSPISKEKPKPTNALVPTVIAYPGGQMHFSVNMGREQATRLMIVKGDFTSLSLAVYGDILSEIEPYPSSYTPKSHQSLEPVPVSRALDPSNAHDPTLLARQLLSLIPDAPPLPLVIRLMFCLKPSNDDWDLPEFPYLHPDLEDAYEDLTLEKAYGITTKPVPDDIPLDDLVRFAENVSRCVGEKDDDQSYYVAGLLRHAASQTPEMAKSLLKSVDLMAIFDSSNMDDQTLDKLSDATANADIARYLQSEWFLSTVRDIEHNPSTDRETRNAARHLINRVEGWTSLEDALFNTQGDFITAAAALRDFSSQEASFGILLESLVTHEDIVSRLSENLVVSISAASLPQLLSRGKSSVSHDDFLAFLRAFMGISCVLAVYAWADSLPHPACRERILGILRLWQGVEGYREILNHLLLLPQMVFRLECMLDNDLPSHSGIATEHILVNLSQDPRAFLSSDLVKCILSLKPPHSFITYAERNSMQAAAGVAEDGLVGAIDELLRPVQRPPTLMSIRVLRVALAVVTRELDILGEYEVVQEFWKEGPISLVCLLADIFAIVSEEIGGQFTLKPPPSTPSGLVAQLFSISGDLLRLILRLFPSFPVPSRVIRTLSTNIANFFVYTDAADMLYNQSSPACRAAQETRQLCIEVIRVTGNTDSPLEDGKLGASVVLRALLVHGLQSGPRDPVNHSLQVFYLIDVLLPLADADPATSEAWTVKVLPPLLRDLWSFCKVLDTEYKAHFVRRLVSLDRSDVGIGDWLLQEELRDMMNALKELEDPGLPVNNRFMRQYQVTLSLRFFYDLMRNSSDVSRWATACLTTDPDTAQIFSSCLWSLFAQDFMSINLARIGQIAGAQSEHLVRDLFHPLVLTILRACWSVGSSPTELSSMLNSSRTLLMSMSTAELEVDQLASDIGATLSILDASPHLLCEGVPGSIVLLLDWFVRTITADRQEPTQLRNISPASFTSLCGRLAELLDDNGKEMLTKSQAAINVAGFSNESSPIQMPTFLTESIEITIQELEDLIRPKEIAQPSTPPRKALNQDILSLVTISPPVPLIRSPNVSTTGLTKTYSNNDFRQLRQTPSARQNTSRLPSMHVDDFESISPTASTLPLPVMQVPVALSMGAMPNVVNVGGMPTTSSATSLPPNPYATAAHLHHQHQQQQHQQQQQQLHHQGLGLGLSPAFQPM